MKFITEKNILKGIETIDALSDDSFINFFENFTKEQPDLVAYIISSSEEHLNDEEGQFLLLNILLFWYVTKIAEVELPVISMDTIIKSEESNNVLFEAIFGENDEEYILNSDDLIEGHPQSELMYFAINATFNNDEMEEAAQNIIFALSKVIIDVLHSEGN
ncbi:MAG: hypothetical protein IPM47_13560 [Sphingobacteriales bacterium]|nr:MAG: hypothetical protein IPM47_13560 [Sphingobacteriales bacterium]